MQLVLGEMLLLVLVGFDYGYSSTTAWLCLLGDVTCCSKLQVLLFELTVQITAQQLVTKMTFLGANQQVHCRLAPGKSVCHC